jgi:hypothetical protein
MNSGVFVAVSVILAVAITLTVGKILAPPSEACGGDGDMGRMFSREGFQTASETLLDNGWDYHVVDDSYPQSRWTYDG